MNNKPMNNSLESEWEHVDAMTDDDVDTSDIPPLTDAFSQRARVRTPKQRITVQIDADLLDWFRAQGNDYEQRMNAALRVYVEAHKAA